MPALAGYSAIGFVSMSGIHALSVAPVIGVWVALAVSLAVVSLTTTPTAFSAFFAWIGATALVTIGAYPLLSLIDIAPLALLLGVFLCLMAPRFALRVPDSQLIDSASVQTIASRIRQPPAHKPSTVTGGRMADALGHTDARYTLLLAASTLFVLVGGIPLAYTVTPAITLGRGLGGFIFVIMSILILLTAPRAGGARAPGRSCLVSLRRVSAARSFLVPGHSPWWWGKEKHAIVVPPAPAGDSAHHRDRDGPVDDAACSQGPRRPRGHDPRLRADLLHLTLLPAAVISSGLFEFAWRAVL